ncbi:AAA family ATPase [Flammeovirga kamogawensis]|uniref:AAA family ATPase n=1 Tax=Flammeovirga kamogawensis TaxID=373891 RepID=A0ABX8GV29_9BACT|nr:AAA family ATPase [Flammeovirga kamogawensis]MBB6459763.1 exonuclease SbcC [Flammeovirga kamogawensis]QWG07178.1 AAA family ATPase [Flammeovirga kamogawensis]TRX68999.1 AAA family ATPase [Flammeovirga kamogawensis]
MKLLKLYIKNINSLRGENTINYQDDELRDAGLIAIVGKTGAGKSTIMDAITLALFNRVPRVNPKNKISKNFLLQSGSMLTRGEKEGIIELDYQITRKGKIEKYRAKWMISTNKQGKNAGEIKDYDMDVIDLNSLTVLNQKKTECPTINEELIGLNFDQFVKSVMLSQGEFARLLKANKKERSDLLEKITRSFDFRKLSILAFEKHKTINAIDRKLLDRIDSLKPLSEEQLADAKRLEKEYTNQLLLVQKKRITLDKGLEIKKELERLVTDIRSKQIKINAIEEELQSKEMDKKAIKEHELVVPIIPLHQSWVYANEKLEELTTKKVTLDNQIALDSVTLSTEEERYSIFLDELEKLIIQIKNEESTWLKVDQLDQDIIVEEESLKSIKKAFESVNTEILEAEKNESEAKDFIRKYKEEQENLLDWSDQNKVLSTLQDHLPLIKSSKKQLIEKKAAFDKQLSQHTEETRKRLKGKDLLESLSVIKGWTVASQQQIDSMKNNHSSSDMSNELLSERIDKFEHAHQSLVKIDQFEAEQKQCILDLETIVKALEEKEVEVGQAKKQEQYLNVSLNEFIVKLERLHFEVSENVVTLRSLLKENEPCVVCGALEHPVSKQEDYSTLAFSEFEKTKKEKEDTLLLLENAQKKRVQFEKELLTLQLKKVALNDTSNGLIEKLKEEKLSIEKVIIALSIKGVSTEKVSAQLLQLKEEMKNRHAIQTKEQLLGSLLEIQKLGEEYEHEWENYKALFIPYLAFTENTLDITLLEKQQLEWNETINRLNQLPSLLEKQQESQQYIKTIITTKEKEKTQLQTQVTTSSSTITALKEKRQLLFGTKIVANERQVFLNTKDLKSKEVDQIKNSISGLQSKLQVNTSSLKTTEVEVLAQKEKQIVTRNTFLKALEGKSLKEEDFLSMKMEETTYLTTKELIESLEKRLTIAITEKKATNEEKERVEKKDEFKEETKEQLVEKIEEVDELIKDITGKLDIQKASLSIEENNKKQLIEVKKERKALASELLLWKTMNTLIGSEKGDKFNVFAQSIVLRKLLHFANIHLEKFTDRYLFSTSNISELEDLFIVDKYAGNQQRTVTSASGGETFLLSLSLSLGLADMASNNTKVESLFIDEGFGTLDEDTLDQAISALEKLNDLGGKTISIISHVTAIKDRIPAKIQLVPLGSGNSKIEVG